MNTKIFIILSFLMLAIFAISCGDSSSSGGAGGGNVTIKGSGSST